MAPPRREREVKLRGQDIGQAVKRERRLVREHAGPLGPEPHDGQLFVLARGEVDQPVDASSDAGDAATADVLQQQLRRVSGVCPLLRREVTVLGARRLVEAVPLVVGSSVRVGSAWRTRAVRSAGSRETASPRGPCPAAGYAARTALGDAPRAAMASAVD
jgi:hypothetical protein